MRKSDFNLKFYTMSYLFCLLNFIFRKVLGFNNEIYLFSWEAYFIHFKMKYCRCFSCKYLLRYELKTECGQFLHLLTGLILGSVLKNWIFRYFLWSTRWLNWEILAWCSGDACCQIAFWGVLPNSLFRIPFSTLSQSKHFFNLFNSHISFSQKIY